MNCNRNIQTITNLISQGYNSWISFGAVGILYQLLIQNILVLIHIYLKEEILSAMSYAKIYEGKSISKVQIVMKRNE